MALSLTHWGRVTHICVGNLTIIGPDNGLSPGRRQAIIWTNAGILLIKPLGTSFSETLIKIHTFSFNKTHLKMLFGKWWPFCLHLDVLILSTVWYQWCSQGNNNTAIYWTIVWPGTVKFLYHTVLSGMILHATVQQQSWYRYQTLN